MAKEHPKKKLAAILFIEQELTAKEVSEILDISENTLSKWNIADSWERQRAARRQSPEKLIARYYKQSDRIIDAAEEAKRPLTSAEVDSLAKLAASVQKLDKSVSVNIVMSVLRNYNNHLMIINPELAKQNVEFQLGYVQSLIDAQK